MKNFNWKRDISVHKLFDRIITVFSFVEEFGMYKLIFYYIIQHNFASSGPHMESLAIWIPIVTWDIPRSCSSVFHKRKDNNLTKSAKGISTRLSPRSRENALDLSMPKAQRKSSNVIEGKRWL